ncbi:MAG: phosphoribosyltransferase [Pseudonocardiales bacterium]|nr:MAG: phosphoribosyltransferase [Pseudonocardiales bacterium]
MLYADRRAAGGALAERLTHLAGHLDVIVLGLPRGGVPVAAAVAKRLRLPLDVLVVRKLGVPWHRELAMGAIAPSGVMILQDRIIKRAGVRPYEVEEVATKEAEELERQERAYRPDKPPLALEDRIALIIDDGLATGASMLAAVRAARALGAKIVIAAAPVGSSDTIRRVGEEADDVVVDNTPAELGAVGQWYDDFGQVPDADVLAALGR